MSKTKRKAKKEKRKEKRKVLKGKLTSAALRPFKRGMLRILKARGVKDVNANSPVLNIALSFYNNVARHSKRNSFEGEDSFEFETFEVDSIIFNPSIHSFDSLEETDASTAAAAVIAIGGALAIPTGGISLIVAPIVAAILKWFKARKAAKAAGETLPPEEEEAIEETEKEIKKETEPETEKSEMNVIQKLLNVFGLYKPKD